jgi:hypothetical protein
MIRTIQCPSGETCYADECVQHRYCMHMDEALRAEPDAEYSTRIEAKRLTLEYATKSTKRLDAGSEPFDESPLWGGVKQRGLFD